LLLAFIQSVVDQRSTEAVGSLLLRALVRHG